MKIIFTCGKGHSSESDIEEMLAESPTYYLATCRCSYCGRLNRVKISKDQFPNNPHDEGKEQNGRP
jgi:hypothetical protein